MRSMSGQGYRVDLSSPSRGPKSSQRTLVLGRLICLTFLDFARLHACPLSRPVVSTEAWVVRACSVWKQKPRRYSLSLLWANLWACEVNRCSFLWGPKVRVFTL